MLNFIKDFFLYFGSTLHIPKSYMRANESLYDSYALGCPKFSGL